MFNRLRGQVPDGFDFLFSRCRGEAELCNSNTRCRVNGQLERRAKFKKCGDIKSGYLIFESSVFVLTALGIERSDKNGAGDFLSGSVELLVELYGTLSKAVKDLRLYVTAVLIL